MRHEEVLHHVSQVLKVADDDGAKREQNEVHDLEGVEEDVGRRAHEEPQESRPIDGEIEGGVGERPQGPPEDAEDGREEQTRLALQVGAVLPSDLEVLGGAFCVCASAHWRKLND